MGAWTSLAERVRYMYWACPSPWALPRKSAPFYVENDAARETLSRREGERCPVDLERCLARGQRCMPCLSNIPCASSLRRCPLEQWMSCTGECAEELLDAVDNTDDK